MNVNFTKMFMSRLLAAQNVSRYRVPNRIVIIHPRYIQNFVTNSKYINEQMEYMKSALDEPETNWTQLKNEVLNRSGNVNQKNFNGVVLKLMLNNQKLDAAHSFVQHLNKTSEELSLGTINGLLGFYYEMGKQNKLTDKEKQFILKTYESLYAKHKVLDSATCEKLLHALCAIGEYKSCYRLLEDINLSAVPTHSAYSTFVATLFNLDKKSEAMEVIQRSLSHKRHLQYDAYEAWIQYILRKYKHKKTKVKHLEEICTHAANNFISLTESVANRLKGVYESLDWTAEFTEVKKQSGKCQACNEMLSCLRLTEDEFFALQKDVKDKLIVGSDLFINTSPQELKRFLQFIEKTAPYDIVIDALNVAFSSGVQHNVNRVNLLSVTVHHFKERGMKIMLLGRKHMLRWPKRPMEFIMSNTEHFFTDNLSQDDPYFITAALMSGAHTDIVSRDLLRGHRFNMRDDSLRLLFQRWQWQHQWMIYARQGGGGPVILPPPKFTPCAQKRNGCWHLLYEKDNLDKAGQVNDGLSNWTTWLCLRPKTT